MPTPAMTAFLITSGSDRANTDFTLIPRLTAELQAQTQKKFSRI